MNGLITTASERLAMDANTLSGNPIRIVEESLKNCIDAINNNGPVVPMTPCNRTNTTWTPPYPE
jgi:hypothetical protein